MYTISGRHAIFAAARNPKRGNMTFFGSKELYRELELKCDFQQSSKNYLRVSEIVPYSTFEDMLKKKCLILLDSLEDPRNLGSIIRSACAFGYGVIIRAGKGCEINETVVRCAAGGVDLTPIFLLKNTSTTLNKLKDQGFTLVGLDENGRSSVGSCVDKVLLVIGSEGSGISRLVSDNLDIVYSIPTSGKLKTLNASVAAAISMNLLGQL